METESQAPEVVMTEETVRLLMHKHGSFRFYAELHHAAVMRAAKIERSELWARLRECGVNPSAVLLEVELGRQTLN